MRSVGNLRGAAIVLPAMLLAGCVAGVKTGYLVPAGKGDLGMQRISVYPVKNSGNRYENAVATRELQGMFVNADVNGKKVFDVLAINELGSIQAQQQIERQALRGSFDQSTVSKLRAKGVEGLVFTVLEEKSRTSHSVHDNKGKKIRCTTLDVSSTFYPKIVRTANAQIVAQDKYTGEASKTACDGLGLGGVNELLAQEARGKALAKLRKDIAPYTQSVEVKLLSNFCKGGMSEALDKYTGKHLKGSSCDKSQPPAEVVNLVKGGEEYAKAGRLDQACERWEKAASLHSDGFITPYLRGVCAELHHNNLKAASQYYNVADSQTTGPVSVINDALNRVRSKMGSKSIKVPGSRKSKPVRKADPLVRSVQQALIDAGYDPGPADGFMGQKTGVAIKYFQEDYSLAVTGKIDNDTKTALGL